MDSFRRQSSIIAVYFTLFGLCLSNAQFFVHVSREVQRNDNTKASSMYEHREFIQSIPESKCETCSTVLNFVTAIDRFGNFSTEVIESSVRVFCHSVMGMRVSPVCDSLVKNLKVARQCLHGNPAHACCKRLKFCSYKTNNHSTPKLKEESDSCIFCTRTTELIEKAILYDKKSLDLIKDGISMMCKHLPKDSQCEVLSHNFDKVISWLEAGMDPQIICQKLRMCDSKLFGDYLDDALPPTIVRSSEKSVESDDSCILCNHVGQIIHVILQYNDSLLPYFKQALSVACQFFPDSSKCNSLIEEFDAIVNDVKEGQDVDKLCQKHHFCSNNFLGRKVLSGFPTGIATSCQLCKATGVAIQTAEAYSPSTIPMIKEALGVFCGIAPPEAKCDDVLSHFDDLEASIRSGKSVEDSCIAAKLCSNEILRNQVEIE